MKTKFTSGCILIVLVLLAGRINAQVTKGRVFIGGTLGFNSDKFQEVITDNTFYGKSENTTRQFRVMPEVGVGIGGNCMAGAGLGFSSGTSQTLSDNGNNVTSRANSKKTAVIAGLFARKYTGFAKNAGIYAELAFDYAWGHATRRSFDGGSAEPLFTDKFTVNSLHATLSPGIYYKTGNRFFVDMKFGGLEYNNALNDDDAYHLNGNRMDKGRKSGWKFTLADNVRVGFRWLLKSEKKK